MDHDYELEDEYAPRILWGRLAFFLLALLLAFVAGRACAPNGVPEEDLQAARAQVTDLASDKAVLEQQLDNANKNAAQNADKKNAGKNKADEGGDQGTTEAEPTEDASAESIADGETYEVQSGDTLTTIAEKFYNDARKFTLISDANNLDDATGLTVGQELVIPPDE